MKIYFAAPLFSDFERALNLTICQSLEQACTVFLPQRDGCLVREMIAQGMPPGLAARQAFELDIKAIRHCDILIAVLDGRAMDEGVCVELGFAKALGKRVIGFKSDSRCALPWGNNPMIDGCVDAWASNVSELVANVQLFASRSPNAA